MRKKSFYVFVAVLFLLATSAGVIYLHNTAFAQEPFTYCVSEDDCLWTIANRFGTTVDEIMAVNGLDSDFLQCGQTLTIPGTDTLAAAGEYGAAGDFSYTVAQGDCLWTIADKFGTTIEDILSANNLNSDFLQPGQTLTIPVKNVPAASRAGTGLHGSYAVAAGDCLWNIACAFGTTVEAIREANGLDSDDLYVGQTLVIPAATASPVQPVSRGSSSRTPLKKAVAGELVSWPVADGLFPNGSTAILQDYRTGLQFKIYRLFGTNHADCEPLTAEDTQIMKKCFGNKWSWERRPVILLINGRAIAASMAGMPHGTSEDIEDNNFEGMFDLHFLNSRTHGTDRIDSDHQAAVREAAGL
ncbi:MAG TPA: LysM peptidoglycan-binding domain-containing protein [Bacillota bacterium]|nr:LysM peptidoglycan-binding domain-containing protein [Bacillota bacterium]